AQRGQRCRTTQHLVHGAPRPVAKGARQAPRQRGRSDRVASGMALTLVSSAFKAGASIPVEYTGNGDDRSPPLAWSGAPAGTKSFALISDDPDAPDPKAPKTTWVHWVLYDIPASARGLPEGATAAQLPNGAREGKNDWKRTGYGGPCPPTGRHRYFFKLYALGAT